MGHESFIDSRANLNDLKLLRSDLQSSIAEGAIPISELQDTKDNLENLNNFISTAESLGAADFDTIFEESALESKLTQEIHNGLQPKNLGGEWFFEYYTIDVYTAVQKRMQNHTAFYLYEKTWRIYYE